MDVIYKLIIGLLSLVALNYQNYATYDKLKTSSNMNIPQIT